MQLFLIIVKGEVADLVAAETKGKAIIQYAAQGIDPFAITAISIDIETARQLYVGNEVMTHIKHQKRTPEEILEITKEIGQEDEVWAVLRSFFRSYVPEGGKINNH